jgi:hypothetical protein
MGYILRFCGDIGINTCITHKLKKEEKEDVVDFIVPVHA